MLIEKITTQKQIESFRLSFILLQAYIGNSDAAQSLAPAEVGGFVQNGVDYVLEGTAHEALSALLLHKWLRDQQHAALDEVCRTVAGRYPIAVGQSLAWGLLDPRAALNGYKCDVDVIIDRQNVDALIADLQRLGHGRRVIDAETGALIEVDEDVSALPDKTSAGSIVIPLPLLHFPTKIRNIIERLANRYQPLNIPNDGAPYLLYGIDAVYAYGGTPIDMQRCSRPHGSIRIQTPEHNAVTTLVRLYYALKLGYLKPNLLLIVLRMLSVVSCARLIDGVAKSGLLPFLKTYLDYHRRFLSVEKFEEYMTLLANVDSSDFTDFTFGDVYESLETLLGSTEV